MIIVSAAQNVKPAVQLSDERDKELKIIDFTKKALNTTERTPLVLESGRIKKESCCECICLIICIAAFLGGITTGAYFLFKPRPEIHPNQCDQYNQYNHMIVNNTGTFMQERFEILVPNQNITKAIVSSFEHSLTSMLTNIRCDKTSTLICVNLKHSLFNSLQGVHALISFAVNTLTSEAGLNNNGALTDAIRMHLCDTVDILTKGCYTHSFCDFIP